MRMLVRYLDGSRTAAILMAMCGGELRVSIPGCDDAVGLRWADGQWLTENGDPVEIQFGAGPEDFYCCLQQTARKRRVVHPWMPDTWTSDGLHASAAALVN